MKKKLKRSKRINLLQGGVLILVLLMAGILINSANAQNVGHLQISALDLQNFPTLRFTMQLQDEQGRYISDLQPNEVQLLEDGYVQSVRELNRLQPGMQVILAVNESPVLTNQLEGVSYYRRMMQTLESWSQNLQPGSPDNFSYVTNIGPQIVQVDSLLFSQALTRYEPDLLAARPGVTSLSMSLDLVTDPLPDPYMKRAILYVTPLPDAAARESLVNIADRAAQLGTTVFVWLIAPGYPLESPEITPLRQLADVTGGDIFLYSGSEDFPNPENYFESLRYIYEVIYDSGVTTSGEHQLITSIIRADLQLTSENILFSVNIAPPNPIFLDPPAQIFRSFPEDQENPLLTPETYPIKIIIEFPDGHRRPILATRLFVNDVIAAENLSPPFDQFMIPLDDYDTSRQLYLRAEVEDSLGFNQSSIETLVELIVEEPQGSWFQTLFTGRGLSILIALLVAGLVLTAVIVFTSQTNLIQRLNRRRIKRLQDPVTQPVIVKSRRENAGPASIESPTIRKAGLPVNTPAQLIRISESGNPIPQRSIPLIRRETTLGGDPQQALCVLDSATVNPLHARIFQKSDGEFYIADFDSTAGTWLNYDQVDQEGKKLEHCDIIHFGLMAFRFELKNPTWVRKPKATHYKTDEI